MRYLPLFLLIQTANIVLSVLGYPVIGVLAVFNVCPWPRWCWIWNNEEDGIYGPGKPHTRWQMFYWSALRNSCNNLRFVPGVSKAGRPLWLVNFTIRGKVFYAKAGWLSDGYPCLSAGAGRW